MMNKLLCFGAVLFGLGFSPSVLAQGYDDSSASADSDNCRAVAGQAQIDGTMQQIVGRACLQADGTWQIVQNPDGSVLWYPVAAYPYPDPWWWGPPLLIVVSPRFFFVDRFHHFHHFYHFHQLGHNHFGMAPGAGFHRGPFPGGGMRGFGGMHGEGGTQRSGGVRRN
jgi:hypothetical protein